jgi:hypothetical protein
MKVRVLEGVEELGGHRRKRISGDRTCRPVGESQAQRCAWRVILSTKAPSEAAEMPEKRAGSAVREKQIACDDQPQERVPSKVSDGLTSGC